MKVVLDPSVLIAASISRAGVCAELLEDVLTRHELVVSDFRVEELGRKLRNKFNFPQNEIRQLQRLLDKVATSVAPLDSGLRFAVTRQTSRFSVPPRLAAHRS